MCLFSPYQTPLDTPSLFKIQNLKIPQIWMEWKNKGRQGRKLLPTSLVISQNSKDAFLYRIKDWDLNKLTSWKSYHLKGKTTLKTKFNYDYYDLPLLEQIFTKWWKMSANPIMVLLIFYKMTKKWVLIQ